MGKFEMGLGWFSDNLRYSIISWSVTDDAYAKTDWKIIKVYFHRGHALRPELDQFRRGIQKCQEAIENSVGGKRQSEYNIYTLKNLKSQSRDSKKSFRRTFGKSPIVQGINKLKLN